MRINSLSWNVRIYLLGITLVIFFLSASFLYNSKSEKVGYVDSEKLLMEYSEAINIASETKARFSEYQMNLGKMDSILRSMQKAITDSSVIWSASIRNQKIENFNIRQQEFNRYRQSAKEQISLSEQEKLKPLLKELDIYIKEFARKEGYSLIFGTSTGGVILYGDEQSDVTEEFLKYVESK